MRLQRASRIVTTLVAVLSLASVVCVYVSGYFRHRQVTALNARTQSLLLSNQFAVGTDKLTAAVRGFAAAGDPGTARCSCGSYVSTAVATTL